MSNPHSASEPSLEEILASIRNMFSDNRPGPVPVPDQMRRTPFGEAARAAPQRDSAPAARPLPQAVQGIEATASSGVERRSFGSLSEALKVANGMSVTPQRALQEDIVAAFEGRPRVAAATREPAVVVRTERDEPAPQQVAGAQASTLSGFADSRRDAGVAPDNKRELMGFAAAATRRDDRPRPSGVGAAPAGAAALSLPLVEEDERAEDAPRAAQPGSAPRAAGLDNPAASSAAPEASQAPDVARPTVAASGATSAGAAPSGGTIALFPRQMREPARPAAVELTGPVTVPEMEAEPAAATPEPQVEAAAPEPQSEPTAAELASPAPENEPAAALAAVVMEAASDALIPEKLLDAVVDMVQQQPSVLSVFASGASFISGVRDKPAATTAVVPEAVAAAVVEAVAVPAPGAAPAKLDRTAAELLRPMLRQWLADNMPRIVEDALRSELTEQTQGGGKDSAGS